MSRIFQWIAKVGMKPDVIAFNAHCWAAFAAVTVFGVESWPYVIAVAAFKEYYLDAKYEVPAQTMEDNTQDFVGYCTGTLLACLLAIYR